MRVQLAAWLLQFIRQCNHRPASTDNQSKLGALFETDILILRHEAAPLTAGQLNSSKNDNGRNSSPSRPMRTISGVLKSP
eukprot:scaffold416_cov165-Skeletonema_dohrnii-CCMP3373.AAC.3